LSTDENVGVPLALAPLEELGEDALGEAEGEELLGEDEELEAPPEALPEDLLSVALGLELEAPPEALPEDLLSVALGLELEPEVCADATLARAKSAAAVAVPTTLNNIYEFLLGEIKGRWGKLRIGSCNEHARGIRVEVRFLSQLRAVAPRIYQHPRASSVIVACAGTNYPCAARNAACSARA